MFRKSKIIMVTKDARDGNLRIPEKVTKYLYSMLRPAEHITQNVRHMPLPV